MSTRFAIITPHAHARAGGYVIGAGVHLLTGSQLTSCWLCGSGFFFNVRTL